MNETIRQALTDAERASLALASEAHQRGDIAQKEVQPGTGVWTLAQSTGDNGNDESE